MRACPSVRAPWATRASLGDTQGTGSPELSPALQRSIISGASAIPGPFGFLLLGPGSPWCRRLPAHGNSCRDLRNSRDSGAFPEPCREELCRHLPVPSSAGDKLRPCPVIHLGPPPAQGDRSARTRAEGQEGTGGDGRGGWQEEKGLTPIWERPGAEPSPGSTCPAPLAAQVQPGWVGEPASP